MKFVCAQPAIDYYAWQVEVMVNNFTKNGINPEDIHIVCSHKGTIPETWKKLQKHYVDVKFFFYKDDRVKPSYISSIRPFILYEHWLSNPELEQETIFYHDCDIVFSKPIDFEGIIDNQNCYVSDTVSYIGANYIRSKGEHYLDLMTSLVGVNKEYVIKEEKNSGGAQYLLKNIPTEFWKKVYYDSENLYRIVNQQIAEDKKKNPSMHEIQIWCADMWAVLWNLWFFDKIVNVSKKLDFSWSTSHIREWDAISIYHNAGVTADRKELFFKGAYINKLPYDIKLEDFDSNFCSYKYAEQILKTKEVSCLI